MQLTKDKAKESLTELIRKFEKNQHRIKEFDEAKTKQILLDPF